MSTAPWFKSYALLNSRVSELKSEFSERCKVLGTSEANVKKEVSQEILARAVHESNWQEGLELDIGHTKELAMQAFDDIEDVDGPHLDTMKVLRLHRDKVIKMKKSGATVEEIGAYNLARAHHALRQINAEFSVRAVAAAYQAAVTLAEDDSSPMQSFAEMIRECMDESLTLDASPIAVQMTPSPSTFGQLFRELKNISLDRLERIS